MSKFRKIVSVLLILVFGLSIFTSCKNNPSSKTIKECLGDYDYDASIAALVYEQVPGEEEGFKGILYRKVLDVNGLTLQNEQAVCFYFYSSVNTGTLGITAGVEDLAQTLNGRVLFVAIDAFEEADLSSAYEVEAYPEFILIKDGVRVSTFNGMYYDMWDMNDVANWMSANGYSPDYSLLEY